MDSKHWDDIYSTKSNEETSWFQEIPHKSIELIREFQIRPEAKVIDIGAGNSKLIENLILMGFKDLSVLDISSNALDKLKARLGANANDVEFIHMDVTKFKPTEKYHLWHDRATFHFLTETRDIDLYLEIAFQALAPDGHLIVSTFSDKGPKKCSGLEISQYSENELRALFSKRFTNIKCEPEVHDTPWGTKQDFVYCGFKKT